MIVRIAALFTGCGKVDHTRCRIDLEHLKYRPAALGKLAFELPGFQVVQIQVAPVVPLREPDKFIAIV